MKYVSSCSQRYNRIHIHVIFTGVIYLLKAGEEKSPVRNLCVVQEKGRKEETTIGACTRIKTPSTK